MDNEDINRNFILMARLAETYGESFESIAKKMSEAFESIKEIRPNLDDTDDLFEDYYIEENNPIKRRGDK